MFYEMKQKYYKRIVEDEQSVQYLMSKGMPRAIAETLSVRKIGKDNYENFVDDKSAFYSPFEMPNMAAAVETIQYVMECGGKILIYGDYDADGLTASSILSLFFSDNGVENDVIIPTRDEGYGLHAENVLRAFETDFYDLLITVDCGISNAEDINRIVSELGVEVIVTDHHELPEVLPDCICINPKMGYPFSYLAGAGVAWKLVEAIAGIDVAAKYSDLACVGTIGDIMPLQDENRALVKMGLSNWRHKSLKKLAELSNCPSNVTANDIALRIAPKINAAGRVGSPHAALDVLLCRDKSDLGKINKLLELNEKRKQLLEEITAQSDFMCDSKVIAKERMVFLYSDRWQRGLLGIVASRYKEKYKLPAVVLTLDEDCYVGSARGTESLNLFEIFAQCKDCLVKFGGHKASVGFSVSANRLSEFRQKLTTVLQSMSPELFEKRFYYDLELGKDCDTACVMKLTEKLQPMLPQDKIVCRLTDSVKFANSFGKDDAHLSATLSCGLEIKGFFKYGILAPIIRNGGNVDLLCTLETDNYTHEICGILEDISLNNSVCYDEFYKLNLLKNFSADKRMFVDKDVVARHMLCDSLAVIFDDYETYLKYCNEYNLTDMCVDVFLDSGQNKTVVISPTPQYDFGRFDKVVYFAREGISLSIANAIYTAVAPARKELYDLELTRDVCAKVYSALRRKSKFDSVNAVYDKYLVGNLSIGQFTVALRVFEELKIIKTIDKYSVEFNDSEKRDLTTSSIFRAFQIKR